METILIIVVSITLLIMISPILHIFMGRDWGATFTLVVVVTVCFTIYVTESFMLLIVVLFILLIKGRRR